MKKLTFFLLLLAAVSAFAQRNITDFSPEELFLTTGEIYFALPDAAPEANRLTKIISIDKIDGNTIYAYASRKEFEILMNSGISAFELLPHPGDQADIEMSSDPRQVMEWNYYPTYTAYEEIMAQFAADYPDICSLHTIATLPSGRKLLAVRISDNVDVEENEPEFLYTATIHGDETTGYILTLHLIDYLLANYNQDPRVTNMVNSTDIWINPLANPDGTYYGGNQSVNGARRYNANNVDLNRNYPDPADGPHPDGNPWQPETVAFMNFAEERDFVMGANFHGGAEVVNYPWDTWSRVTADNNWWVMVSREYADTAQAHSPSGYLDDLDNGITHGYAWYRITGGRQDYMNYFQQCREVTLEISNTKLLPASQLLNFWEYNYRSMLNYLEQVQFGVHGVVTDTVTGEPVAAQVLISGHDMDSSMVFSSLPVGNYHRLLKAGTYNLTFIAEGYLPKTVRNVVVNDKSTTVRNVKLWDGSAIPAFTSSTTTTYPGGSVQFFDNSGGNPTSRLWTFEGADIQTSTEPSPVVTYSQPGSYDVTLYVENMIGGNQLTMENYITVEPDFYIGNPGSTTCNARFFDSNGPDGSYSNNENLTTTFYADDPDRVFRIHFISFDVESTPDCSGDALLVYDGPDATATLIARLCGNTLPDDILTSVGGGAVTFVFISDAQNTGSGWEAIITCDSGVGIHQHDMPDPVQVYPNPSGKSGFMIRSDNDPIMEVRIYDISGRMVYSAFADRDFVRVPEMLAGDGLYLLTVRTSKGNYTRKLIIRN
ncbi:MAG: T9SS type A sorting domain-containing protein [Lentimicrobium sp.]|nr:T9SS type A sorting domain-containing protein [Lentimicrobium sp.]